jgi:hypothetical protein
MARGQAERKPNLPRVHPPPRSFDVHEQHHSANNSILSNESDLLISNVLLLGSLLNFTDLAAVHDSPRLHSAYFIHAEKTPAFSPSDRP